MGLWTPEHAATLLPAVAVMLALCAVMVTQIIHQQSLCEEISLLEGKLDSARKRLAKQEKELAEYTAELPLVQQELEEVQPAADAAAQRVDDLKAERRALREENAAQAKVIADLEAQLAELPDPDETNRVVDEAVTTLDIDLLPAD